MAAMKIYPTEPLYSLVKAGENNHLEKEGGTDVWRKRPSGE